MNDKILDFPITTYLKTTIKATCIKVGVFVKMDNTTSVTFTKDTVTYSVHLPKYESVDYYNHFFSTNYPELFI